MLKTPRPIIVAQRAASSDIMRLFNSRGAFIPHAIVSKTSRRSERGDLQSC
ncbi:hypothetical protein [Terrarubrum flagellatum]|uniref:hypothetical protein n=1 Tax=Terrirubrum flagellatum TaxID=2895980 RepID=UPI00314536E9